MTELTISRERRCRRDFGPVQKHKERMLRHNRELAEKQRGDAHWARRDPEAMQRWIDAMKQGRQARRNAQKEVMPG